MSEVDITVTIIEISEARQIATASGIDHEILELEVADKSGSMKLVLWNEKIGPLNVGDKVRIENGFVTSFKGVWRLNVGRNGTINKVDQN